MLPSIIRKQTAPLTSHQLFVGLWRCRFLLPQDSNPPSVLLTTPHFRPTDHSCLQLRPSEINNDTCAALCKPSM